MAKKSNTELRNFALAGFLLLAVLFGMQIMTFIFGNLGAIDQFEDDTRIVTNESVALALLTGVGTIADVTNPNFVSWNASLVLNATEDEETINYETLVEGTDYELFPLNGSIGNITGDWNTTVITYSDFRKPEAQLTSEEVTNDSLQAVSNYSTQAGTQFTTLGIAITLVILVLVFAFFWKAFMGRKDIGDTGGAGSFA